MTKYAVNLVALMNINKQPEHLPLFLLLRGIVTETVVQDGEQLGKEALLVRDDISDERWRAIVKIVQMKFSPEQFPLYENAGKGWKRIRK